MKETAIEYLLARSNKIESGCWEWTLCKDKDGYGIACSNSKRCLAHRLSYSVYNGPIGEGLYVCHKCDNPKCINPDHLFLGTHKENMHDMVVKGRKTKTRSHCKLGHELSPDNLVPSSKVRRCQKCFYEYQRNYHQKKADKKREEQGLKPYTGNGGRPRIHHFV